MVSRCRLLHAVYKMYRSTRQIPVKSVIFLSYNLQPGVAVLLLQISHTSLRQPSIQCRFRTARRPVSKAKKIATNRTAIHINKVNSPRIGQGSLHSTRHRSGDGTPEASFVGRGGSVDVCWDLTHKIRINYSFRSLLFLYKFTRESMVLRFRTCTTGLAFANASCPL